MEVKKMTVDNYIVCICIWNQEVKHLYVCLTGRDSYILSTFSSQHWQLGEAHMLIKP